MGGKRDLQLDGLKFILMFLVILGHMHINFPIGRPIYSFHMPLFVLLSGYFTIFKDNKKMAKWLKKTITIYLLFVVFNLLIDFGISHISFSIKHVIDSFYKPPLAMWYLLCIIYWRLTIFLLGKIKISVNHHLFLISLLLALIMGFVPLGHEFSFQRAFALFPFFILGKIIRDNNGFNYINKINLPVAFGTILLGLYFSYLTNVYMPKEPYETWQDCLVRLFQTTNALVLCIAFLRLSRLQFLKCFSVYGSITLYFYLYHILFVRIIESLFTNFHTSLFFGIILTMFIMGCIIVMVKCRCFRLLLLQK